MQGGGLCFESGCDTSECVSTYKSRDGWEHSTIFGLTCLALDSEGDARGSVRGSSLVSLDALLPAASSSGVLARLWEICTACSADL